MARLPKVINWDIVEDKIKAGCCAREIYTDLRISDDTFYRRFEEHFLMEMENKLPDVMAEFKKGNLPEDGLKKMVELANGLIPQYKG